MKRTKITSAIVAVALGVACIASVTAEKFRTTEYGRIVVASVLYDEPATSGTSDRNIYYPRAVPVFESNRPETGPPGDR